MKELEIAAAMRQRIEEYSAEQRRTNSFLASARAGTVPPRLVGSYLASLKYNVSHTPKHLELAHVSAVAAGAPALADYFSQKMQEEEGHEQWGTDDLAVLKQTLGVGASAAPVEAAVKLMTFVEQTIRRDPRLYISYVLFTEYITVLIGGALTDALVDKCGIPRSALTIVDKHVEADVAHVKDGFAAAGLLLNDPSIHAPAFEVLETTMRLFSNLIAEVGEA